MYYSVVTSVSDVLRNLQFDCFGVNVQMIQYCISSVAYQFLLVATCFSMNPALC